MRADALAIVRAGVAAVAAPRLVDRAWCDPEVAGFVHSRRAVVIAAGKAAWSMTSAVVARTGPGAFAGGVVAGPPPPRPLPAGFEAYPAGHPLPDERSVAAGARALAWARQLDADDRLLVLLSGGASALLALPRPGISLAAKAAVTALVLAAGVDIVRLNVVRKHLSAIKGGWLAASTRASVLTLAISDVVAPAGRDLEVIGSGPTVADPTTFADALAVLDEAALAARVPDEVRRVLEQGASGRLSDTPKPGDPRLARSAARVIGGRAEALEGARQAARARGYDVCVLPHPLVGEARQAGPALVDQAVAAARPLGRPACVLAAGETTVRVQGSGRGGRNQELALAAARRLADLAPPVLLAAVATDGIDGPTDAAGAIVDSTTLGRARALGLESPEAVLGQNDAYPFFDRLGDLVRIGPTDTNVGDLQVVLFG